MLTCFLEIPEAPFEREGCYISCDSSGACLPTLQPIFVSGPEKNRRIRWNLKILDCTDHYNGHFQPGKAHFARANWIRMLLEAIPLQLFTP